MGPLVIALSLAGASCKTAGTGSGASIVQPGAPGQPTRTIAAAAAADRSRIRYTAADVRFMQGMIGHHEQALEMTALVPSRTSRDALKLLAQRIDVSQRDEIAMMRTWLEARGQPVPDPHAHHHGAAAASTQASPPLMPGMLTAEEMARLAAARGHAFDRLFLESMIKHHDGALVMVKELFGTPGAGQEAEMFAFASDVDADQRMEIDRMSALLKEWQQ
jgi:uncharacterized protein (DUF305 family)